jgi:hypothetical protein
MEGNRDMNLLKERKEETECTGKEKTLQSNGD